MRMTLRIILDGIRSVLRAQREMERILERFFGAVVIIAVRHALVAVDAIGKGGRRWRK